ncbi:FAS-associated factor 1 [Notothenia coriiceps]|uniref:FAS-associated factor 1 n=1 Tax=Notothenia coriiceps TaxID=8208 RepID=A0A6I9Q044_9TELE|nr:PREDICTED: FAS-associated factor 1 [Notothenia coriiceps]
MALILFSTPSLTSSLLCSNFSSEASQAGMFGPPSQSEAADAAAGGAVPTPSSSSLSSSPPSSSTSAFCPVNSASPASSSSSSSSRQIVERQPRMLNFRVEYRQRTVDLVLEEGSTVGEIKTILETELAVPVSKMQLKGWKSGDVSDTTVMRSLHLPKNNSLYVLTPEIAPTAGTSTSKNSGLQESLNQNFLLVISHREAQRDYSLNFPGSKTIQEVKRNVSDLTNIPVRHQQWDGWPASASDDSMTLAVSGITFPCHHLSVCRRSSAANSQEPTEECADVHMVSDSDADDFEDASEFGVDDSEMFGLGSSTCRKAPMMPENSENEADALLHFTAEFSSRYGETHPMFFIGTLEAASQEAFYGKARDLGFTVVLNSQEATDKTQYGSYSAVQENISMLLITDNYLYLQIRQHARAFHHQENPDIISHPGLESLSDLFDDLSTLHRVIGVDPRHTPAMPHRVLKGGLPYALASPQLSKPIYLDTSCSA